MLRYLIRVKSSTSQNFSKTGMKFKFVNSNKRLPCQHHAKTTFKLLTNKTLLNDKKKKNFCGSSTVVEI